MSRRVILRIRNLYSARIIRTSRTKQVGGGLGAPCYRKTTPSKSGESKGISTLAEDVSKLESKKDNASGNFQGGQGVTALVLTPGTLASRRPGLPG
ncbi:hypothetical protein CCM_07533 [Cordyceps militaris CM01]|uniref:Uncharacterized protein n=1 Tax=Cordyceps militaris (strain CM01) TaxID=983644 RepID=G3JQ30_CORMM|nr:uncharacterized protein CCM_07533 [Cordyceps militaris CM01]EGX89281.1 hypothetical protein CCM_07533 [Cordyceps militaris CM01]